MKTETKTRILGREYCTTLIGNLEILTEYLCTECDKSIVINNITYYDRFALDTLLDCDLNGWRIPTFDDIRALNRIVTYLGYPMHELLSKDFCKESADMFGLSLCATGLINHNHILLGNVDYSCFMIRHRETALPWSHYAGMHRDSDTLDIYHCDIETKLPVRLIRF